MTSAITHKSVLLKETADFLNVTPGGIFLDATLGGGGHTKEILRRGGRVIGIDRDPQALEIVRSEIGDNKNFRGTLGNFNQIDRVAKEYGGTEFNGVVFDLGLSSFQLLTEGRGFSFKKDERLDMRTSPTISHTARDVVNNFTREELYEIFTRFGEERLSSRLADLIKARRSVRPIDTTGDLYEIIRSAAGSEINAQKVAQRVFQALRIFVNDEVANLKEALPAALEIMGVKGRLVVISYHSLEDRLVKGFFLRCEKEGKAKILTKHPIVPAREEISENTSSRSGKLRAVEKIYD